MPDVTLSTTDTLRTFDVYVWKDNDNGNDRDTGEQERHVVVTVIDVEIQSPIDTDGDGNINDPGNEFTFTAASSGVLTILVQIQIRPDTPAVRTHFQNKVRIRLTAIDDSHTTPGGADVQLSWDNAYSGETTAGSGTYNAGNSLWEATATFTGLPPDNDDFGQKTVTVDVFSGTVSISTVTENYEVFYNGTATNHPGGTATDPNWFHYYRENVGGGTFTYTAVGRSTSASGGGEGTIRIGDEAYAGDNFITTNVVNGQLTATVGQA